VSRDGVRLALEDFGGAGPPVLLLHGLAGHTLEWAHTGQYLTDRHRVLALALRGHGGSERTPGDVSPEAHVADVAFVIDELGLARAAVVGHSLGGVIALLVAAEHPELIRALVIADACPQRPHKREVGVAKVRHALARWPVPFASREEATRFFGGPSMAAQAWVGGLEQRRDGWWPQFDAEVMVRTMHEVCGRDYWEEWEQIRCPTLVVRAGRGMIPRGYLEAMSARMPSMQLREIEGAGHDLHLDRPGEWLAALDAFLGATDPRTPPVPP
jgi:pimeloyl-ACP methyl ester carboxylesterase